MKEPTILKSLTELSPEFLEAEAANPEPIKPAQTQAQTQEPHSIPSKPRTGYNTRGYQSWGLNE